MNNTHLIILDSSTGTVTIVPIGSNRNNKTPRQALLRYTVENDVTIGSLEWMMFDGKIQLK